MKRATLLRLALLGTLAIVGVLLWLNKPAPPRYTVIDLGVLPGYFSSSARSLNNQGEVVGTCRTSDGLNAQHHAYLYHNGAMTDIGALWSQGNSGAGAINAQGEIVGDADVTSGYHHTFLYHQNNMQDIGILPGFQNSRGMGINNRGQIVGITTKIYPGPLNQQVDSAFLYSAGKTTSISPLPGCTSIHIANINNNGQVVGKCVTVSNPFIYDISTKRLIMLKIPQRFTGGYAQQINDQNQVIATFTLRGGFSHAALWENGKMTDLGTLRNQQGSFGLAINNQGEAVGVSGSDVGFLSKFLEQHWNSIGLLRKFINMPSSEQAFVYQNGKMTDLNSLIPSGSHWALEQANGINDKGQIIGNGLHNGKERAFLLTPIRE